MREPRFRREGGTRDIVLPGNKKYIEGDMLPRSGEGGGGRPSEAGSGDGEDEFRFVLSREEFLDLFLEDLELPDLAKRKLHRPRARASQRAGYTTSGSPAQHLRQPHHAPLLVAPHRAAAAEAATRSRRSRPRRKRGDEARAAPSCWRRSRR